MLGNSCRWTPSRKSETSRFYAALYAAKRSPVYSDLTRLWFTRTGNWMVWTEQRAEQIAVPRKAPHKAGDTSSENVYCQPRALVCVWPLSANLANGKVWQRRSYRELRWRETRAKLRPERHHQHKCLRNELEFDFFFPSHDVDVFRVGRAAQLTNHNQRRRLEKITSFRFFRKRFLQTERCLRYEWRHFYWPLRCVAFFLRVYCVFLDIRNIQTRKEEQISA